MNKIKKILDIHEKIWVPIPKVKLTSQAQGYKSCKCKINILILSRSLLQCSAHILYNVITRFNPSLY